MDHKESVIVAHTDCYMHLNFTHVQMCVLGMIKWDTCTFN